VRASQTLQATIIRIDEPSENNFVVLGDFNDNPDNESVMGLTNCDTGFVRKTFMNSLMALRMEHMYTKVNGMILIKSL